MSEEYLLQQALSNYGLANARTRLLQSFWNHVYYVEADDGKQFGLRICPLEFRDKSSLEDELNWLAYITKRSQILAPRPVGVSNCVWKQIALIAYCCPLSILVVYN